MQMLAIASKSEYNKEKEAILWQIHLLFMQE
nr:MAG TPA: hypothetical protein [Caudoviricetes sp.]